MSTPSTLPVQRETKKFKENVIKEGQTFRRKGKGTRTTLAGSQIYTDPSKNYE